MTVVTFCRRAFFAALISTAPLQPAIFAADAPPARPATAPAADAERPEIEVTFVLDTTGSMGGLIEGAKQKIWTIANFMIAQKDKPRIKIGLVAYRDRGDQYITKIFDLSDDIDTVFKNLMSFKAEGGGDGPESVNQALNEALTKITWSEKPKTTRLIFLVGDAPPHMDYPDDVKYSKTCEAAAAKDVSINTVQCGRMPETTPVWQEIAKLGKGRYIAVPQDGGMVAIAAPQDKELADLNGQVAMTTVPYGVMHQQMAAQQKMTENAAPATRPAVQYMRASRAVFNAGDGGRAIQGRGDLVWDSQNGVVKLNDLKREELPAELAKLSAEQLKELLANKQKDRDALQAKIAKLAKERADFIDAERKRLASSRPSNEFDEKVAELVHEQFEAKRK